MKRGIIVFIIVLVLFSGNSIVHADDPDPFDYARAVYDYILKNYYGDIDEDILSFNLIRAIIDTLDDYSIFMTPEEALEFLKNVSGEYDGIGISFQSSDGLVRIISVEQGAPAKRAGIIPGDQIIEVDSQQVGTMTINEITDLIKGRSGESVKLLIKREGNSELLKFNIVREHLTLNSVSYRTLDSEHGYIAISAFNDGTYKQVRGALEYFTKRGIDKIVLDLRDNGGGLVNQAIMVAGLFVKEGNITTLDFENPEYTDLSYVSSLIDPLFQLNVLVNGNTASAAELLAAAIKESDSGKIIGTRTFGKGIFQSGWYIASYESFKNSFEVVGIDVTNANSEGYVHMTTGRYLTPLGNDINNVGLSPDTYVAYDKNISMIKRIDRTSSYFNYDPGTEEQIIVSAKMILNQIGSFSGDINTEKTVQFSNGISEFQRKFSINATGTLNYITKRALDHEFFAFTLGLDNQLKEALKQLDAIED